MWLTEQQSNSLNEQQLHAASQEIADILIYLLQISDVLGIDPIQAAKEKKKKIVQKISIEKGLAFAVALSKT